MKTAILTISIALASAFSALAQTVMRENSTVYFQTNVFLHDDPTNPLHQRLSFEGQEPLWVAASNQVVYYLGGEFTNGNFHASNAVIKNLSITGDSMTLAQSVKSRNAASVGEYGAAFGSDTTAGDYGAAFGGYTTAGNFGAAFGVGTTAGDWGFSAGRNARGSTGSFVFADSAPVAFNRTNSPNSFSVRAAGGTYFDTPELVVTGAVTATKYYLRTDNSSWLYSDGTNLFFISTVPPGFTNALTTNTP